MPVSWQKVGKAKVWGKAGNYFPEDGKFKLKLLKTYTIKTRSKGEAFIADFQIVDTNLDINTDKTYNWYQTMQDEDIAFSAIKEFMLALLGIDMEDEEQMEQFEEELPEIMEEAGSESWQNKDPEDHPLYGRTIALETSHKLTKNEKDFTVHDWEAWEPEEEEEDDEEEDDDD